MTRAILLVLLLAVLLAPAGATTGSSETTRLSETTELSAATGSIRARDVLPPEGLVPSSVVRLPDQAALDAHYFLAEESLLGLGRTTDAVFARYRTEAGEALLLAAVYPSAEEAAGVYGRFGGDFFSRAFKPASPRFVERIETGDWAGAALKGPVLVVVLEAPDRASCDDLLRRAEKRTAAAKTP